MNPKSFIIVLLLSIVPGIMIQHAMAHGGEDHKKKPEQTEARHDSMRSAPEDHRNETAQSGHAHHDHGINGRENQVDEFPSYHPLVVHFPIVLLLLAVIAQIAGLFVFRDALGWVTLALLAGGFAGAWLAGNWIHPHTAELSESAAKVLEEHEFWASWTVWLSLIALIGKSFTTIIFRKKRLWVEITLGLLLAATAISVGIAGHKGARLVHIEGVGPQGNHLDNHSGGYQHSH